VTVIIYLPLIFETKLSRCFVSRKVSSHGIDLDALMLRVENLSLLIKGNNTSLAVTPG